MTFTKASLFALMVAALSPAPSFAQPSSWRDVLNLYYRYDVAFDGCDAVQPGASEMLRLERAIEAAEANSGLTEDALDEAYSQVEYEAEADKAAFCAEMADAVQRVRDIPDNR
ncbi:MAG: hypothetical protein JWN93_3441 [Hyphomicrobiales bacterium]|nr:hypothetical protein [Hyphomicrobiales bacterium]